MKIRIYKLAKELKTDNEKIIAEAKRLGEKVYVPSNCIKSETAEKIRSRFSNKAK